MKLTKKQLLLLSLALILVIMIFLLQNRVIYAVLEDECQARAELPQGRNPVGDLTYKGSGTLLLRNTAPHTVGVVIKPRIYKDGQLIPLLITESRNIGSGEVGNFTDLLDLEALVYTEEGQHNVTMVVNWIVQSTFGGTVKGSGSCTDSHNFLAG